MRECLLKLKRNCIELRERKKLSQNKKSFSKLKKVYMKKKINLLSKIVLKRCYHFHIL